MTDGRRTLADWLQDQGLDPAEVESLVMAPNDVSGTHDPTENELRQMIREGQQTITLTVPAADAGDVLTAVLMAMCEGNGLTVHLTKITTEPALVGWRREPTR